MTISRLPSAVLHLVIVRFAISSSSDASDEYSRSHDTAPSSVGNVITQNRPEQDAARIWRDARREEPRLSLCDVLERHAANLACRLRR